MRNKFFQTILICVIIVVACLSLIGITSIYLNFPVNPSSDTELFTVARGASMHEINATLKSRSLIRSELFANMFARVFNLALKAGTFKLSPSMTTSQILLYIDDGKQEYTKVTVPEGLTLLQTAKHLEETGVVNADEFSKAARNPTILAKFHITGKDAEGYLFPDTYFFPYNEKAETVVTMMLQNFFTKVDSLEKRPVTPAELNKKIILASIIEREYRVADEAPFIASVFTNRLKIGMGLQSCATIEYIITDIQLKPHPSKLSLEDLTIKSDYNTYMWAGLPPGPISNPGLVAINAAFSPADTKYLYFRLTDPDAGTHSFTHSLDEHIEAGRHLVLKKAAGN